jgi:hypothetical protein
MPTVLAPNSEAYREMIVPHGQMPTTPFRRGSLADPSLLLSFEHAGHAGMAKKDGCHEHANFMCKVVSLSFICQATLNAWLKAAAPVSLPNCWRWRP